MDYVALKAELDASHPVTGAYNADNALAAAELNALNRTRNKASLTGDQLFTATDTTDFGGLTDHKRNLWVAFCSKDVDPFASAIVMANNAVQIFDGSPTTVIATTGTIADTIFSVNSTNATITQFDNSTDLWPLAVATLEMPDTFLAAPTAGTTIDLYMCRDDVGGGTADETAPTTALVKGAKYVGSFGPLYAVDENQPLECIISLVGVRKCRFFIQNNSGTTMSYSAGATVKVEGFTYTPSV